MTRRFWTLALKELRQIRRDRRTMLSLIVPPVGQLLVLGLALDPEVKDMRVGIVDESRTPESRDLVSAITENRTLRLAGTYPTSAALERAIAGGRLDLGVVVPYDFARRRARGQTASVQVLINGVNDAGVIAPPPPWRARSSFACQRPGGSPTPLRSIRSGTS